MHVLVSGASGFVGQHLCEELLKKGFEVTGVSRSPKRINFVQQSTSHKLQMNYCDITKENDLLDLFNKVGPVDGIFHLAGQPYRRDSPGVHIYIQNNFLGTLNILECCRIFNIEKFVFSSSYAVYGLGNGQHLPQYLPVDESHIMRPYDFYDASKYHAEQLCKFYHDRFGIVISILRYSKIYGPGLEEGVVYELIRRALLNLPIEVLGDIGIDFAFIDDVVKANLSSFDKVSKYGIYNIGSGQELTLFDLCHKIIELTNSKSGVRHSKESTGHLVLDISKAKRDLDYEPSILEECLLAYIDYIKKRLRTIRLRNVTKTGKLVLEKNFLCLTTLMIAMYTLETIG
jgi:UDP-glucose 4-epimerase